MTTRPILKDQKLDDKGISVPLNVRPSHDGVEIDYEALPENSPVVAQLVAGAFAGIMEHTVMYPIDAIKTRMQTLKVPLNEGVIQSFSKISSTEGAIALWRGVSSVVLGAGPAHAVYYLVFESTKTALCQLSASSHTHGSASFITDEKHPIIASMSGIAATITSDALMTPFDVLKQRMQILNKKVSGRTSMSHVAWDIYKREGLRQFYISYPTTLILNIPFAAINFGVYEYSSSKLNPDQLYNPLLHCVSGGVSGAAAAALTTPLDCIKTALQTRTIPNVRGFKSAAIGLYKAGGSSAFWRGLSPRVIFNVPSTAISWTAYEMAKAYLLNDKSEP
ncbi:hypothetical protein KL930_001627 [Ogataea haglerorum]|uniref:Uncharacterized protein n=1 Tax=Ogataea haglerorum TaxID=1937702 RepID=A0AAN6I1R9_9ASCO|nr:hypothetical protein KL951_001457 [Ogataea haglerorum]KAG7729831.1 hypothetical protein KL933_000911 [Ogataea haglerorum]KAG7732741.1 hypothetical protein KL948_002171 [Ogataea haglerorum]KAG7749653.1 hypothetical protein KL912_001654 [Ogataea haglerorum]KAG7760193.1 hypothetical protein KL947_001037 [Ogataea haglerorum]